MNNSTANTARSLEMVVSAPIDDCVYALKSLHKGGWLVTERISVHTRLMHDSLCKFEVTLSITEMESKSRTTLRGTLREDRSYRTTTLVASVPSKWKSLLVKAVVMLMVVLGFSVPLIQWQPYLAICTLYVCILVPFGVWGAYINDMNNAQRLLTMIERALQVTHASKRSKNFVVAGG